MADQPYKKLTGRTRANSFGWGFRLLYAGEDHLLHVESTGYTEEYKRFYYREIQGITLQKTGRRRRLNIGLSIGLALGLGGVALGAWLSSTFPDATQVVGFMLLTLGVIFAPAFLVALVVNNIKGDTCKTLLKTAVQTEELISLRRVRKAQKTLREIRERIAAAQGTLDPDELAQWIAAQPAAPLAPPRTAPPPLS